MNCPAVAIAGALALFLNVPATFAQNGRARLVVTVADPSGAVVPNASVRVVGTEDAKSSVVAEAKTTDKGIAAIEDLVPGRYSIHAEFPGFEAGLLKDVRLRAGDNKHLVILPIKKMETEVTVGRDAQTIASSRKDTFGTAMTREQIEALSDDPEEMARQLREIAGPDAVLRIDSFEGGKLPPKAQIKAIHITRDSFAAENHYAGGLFVDVITQPGVGPLAGGANYRGRDGALNARNPYAGAKGPERTQSFGFNLRGTLLKERSSYSLYFNGTNSFDTPLLKAATSSGERAEIIGVRRPRNYFYGNGLLDYALTRDQTFRASFFTDQNTSRNNGIGGFDFPERAYSNTEKYYNLRLQEAGPLGRRFFINTRLEFNRTTADSQSVVEALTVRVNDASTTGGAQVAGGRDTRTINLASDLDYVRGIHSLRTGIVLNGGRYQTDESSNYIGTYIFESVADFDAGIARNFTRRIGDPNIVYWNLQAGVYLQDDIRVSKTLTLSPGVRYEAQTHLNDYSNFGPRFGFTWSPFKNGKTTFRASSGIFYDWLSPGTYEQTLRIDGYRQQEINIAYPAYPDPGNASGTVLPTNRYMLAGDLPMVRNMRVSAGFDQRFTPRFRVGATYSDTRGVGLLRGRNLNAPVAGVRPQPAFGNIVEVVADARSATKTLSSSANLSFSAPSPALQKARVNWRRGSAGVGYTLSRLRNNTDGAFSTPATGDLAAEWGAGSFDVRHRLNLSVNSQALKNLSAFVYVFASSAPPYSIRTGRDDNGDLIFNDRPAGVGRNTGRGSGQVTVNASFNYMVPIGKRKIALPPGIMITSGATGLTVNQTAPQDAPRYRLNFNLSVQNLTNRTNHGGYNGTLTSPFYGRPTTAFGMRKIDVGMGVTF